MEQPYNDIMRCVYSFGVTINLSDSLKLHSSIVVEHVCIHFIVIINLSNSFQNKYKHDQTDESQHELLKT